jgi:hypothetical protein
MSYTSVKRGLLNVIYIFMCVRVKGALAAVACMFKWWFPADLFFCCQQQCLQLYDL